ncbi:MAG: PBSX family phage terminase large subunit [Oscillospiraceae bacterium]|jgi:PBSX family phage terminase large subunit|nr:PBSX family phage terminase large subunit [Oscillospiraceae bacterium]
MRFRCFSKKQLEALTWWHPGRRTARHDAIICDGAVRSGKTLCLSLSFILWAMAAFSGQNFAFCGKTITALRRNVIAQLPGLLSGMGMRCAYKASQNRMDVEYRGARNVFYLFGGRDEGSAALIQGVTLAGVLLDEVALMPRSFVEQALARCSVDGARFWMNCNPSHPRHWFYREWIMDAEQKNALYLHFTMADNPSLSKKVLARYESLYTGVFYERYVLGRWTAVHGAVYPMFSKAHIVQSAPRCGRYVISCDYGTVNPASFGLWGESGGVWYRLREYYHDSRRAGAQMTDSEYADALETLAGAVMPEAVLVDPSAASFIQCLRRRGRYPVIPARNDVADGIRIVGEALQTGKMLIHQSCRDCIREFSLYRWEENGRERPRKEYDHAMDDMRYFALYAFGGAEPGFYAMAASR